MSAGAARAGEPDDVEVTAVIDSVRFGGLPLRVMLLGLAVLVLDGFDIQAVAFAAPALAADWQIERTLLGPVLAAGLVGMGIGAVLFGWLGDRFGRKRTLIASTLLFAGGSLLCAAAGSVGELVLWRFVTGIGLGAPLPLATALMAEFTPRAWRNFAVAVAVVGIPIGGMLGAAIAQDIVPRLGWQSIFIAGAVLPALLTLGLAAWLPESPKFLASRPGSSAELARLLNRIVGRERFAGTERFYVAEPAAPRASVAALLSGPLRATTLVLWLLFFTNIFVVYVYFNWLPMVLSAAGLPLSAAIRGSLAFNLGGVIGSLAIAVVITRCGSRGVLAALALGSVIFTFWIGRNAVFTAAGADAATVGLLLNMALAGACINGVQIGLYAIAAHVYPTALRATGVGCAGAASRVGGILSTFAGSVLFAFGLAGAELFGALAVVLVVTLLGVLALRGHIPRRAAPAAPQAASA